MKKHIDLKELDEAVHIVYFAETQFLRDTIPGEIASELNHIIHTMAWGKDEPTDQDFEQFRKIIGDFRKYVDISAVEVD
jgi:hypothetical protein